MTLTAFMAALLNAARQQDSLHDERERLHRFSELLRKYRLGISVDAKALGDFSRLPNRIGKIVSQEELAEAIGVSRCWYGLLEVGRVRPSIALLERTSNALMLDDAKRLQLIELVFPAFSESLSQMILGQSSAA